MINLSERLKTVADFTLEDNTTKKIVDVGCDHALVPIYLLQKNDKLNIVASDINTGPLQKAKENISKYSLLDKIKLELADGIEKIDEDTDTLIIAGMGMDTITYILEKNKEKLDSVYKLIISSNNKFLEIRKKITSLGYFIEKEKIVFEDGKYYVIIKFLKGKNNYNEKEFYFGPYLLKNKDELFFKYYEFIKREKLNILESLPSSCEDKIKKIEEEIKMLTSEIES